VRRTGYGLAFGAALACLAVTGWPGDPADPGTWLNRADVIAVPVLAGAGWAAWRVFGPAGGSRLARSVRAGGYLAVFAVLLLKARVERSEYAAWHGGVWLAGLWTGEILFLAALAAYVAGLTGVTARRSPVRPAALAVGTVAGVGFGLVLLALPPLGDPLRIRGAALTVLHGVGWWVAVPLVLAGGIAAGAMAARRISDRGSVRPLSDLRARQGVATGLCAGTSAALLVSVVGLSVAALLAHGPGPFPLALPRIGHAPASVLVFEVSLSVSAAGYLLPLVVFPVLGAGLGAWGGMLAGQPASGPGGGGGGGGSGQPEAPSPPADGSILDDDREPELVLSGR
jgi:hypothetical protein